MTALNKQALREAAESTIGILENIAGFESSDIDCDVVELRFETEGGFDTGCDVSIVDQCQKASDVIRALLDEQEAAEKRIAELEARIITVKFEPIPMEELGNRGDGKKHPYMFGAGYNSAVVHCESVLHQACAAAGIGVKGE